MILKNKKKFKLEKEKITIEKGKCSNQKNKITQFQNKKFSNQEKEIIPIRKRTCFQSKLVNGEIMTEEQEGEQKDKNKCMDRESELAVKNSDVNQFGMFYCKT